MKNIKGVSCLHYTFLPNEVAHITGSSTRTLRYYHEIGLLIPSIIAENGYRYYSESDIEKLQEIQFLKNMGLSLSQIHRYCHSDIEAKNKLLEAHYQQILKRYDELEQRLQDLQHHLTSSHQKALDELDYDHVGLHAQYAKEAKIKYGQTDYYQSYSIQQVQQNSACKKWDERIEVPMNQFFDCMNEYLIQGVSATQPEVYLNIVKLKNIILQQVPQCDTIFLNYMATLYEEDTRFSAYINRHRREGLNCYISEAIRAYIA